MGTHHIWDTSTGAKCSEKPTKKRNPGRHLIVLTLQDVVSSAQGGNNNVVVLLVPHGECAGPEQWVV